MKQRFNYHCIQCDKLIAASNQAMDVPNICSVCEFKHTKAMVARQKEKLNVDEASARRKSYYFSKKLKKEKDARKIKALEATKGN